MENGGLQSEETGSGGWKNTKISIEGWRKMDLYNKLIDE